jgi:hypothetical protein
MPFRPGETARFRDGRDAIVAAGEDAAAERPFLANQAGQPPGVEVGDRHHALAPQELPERLVAR